MAIERRYFHEAAYIEKTEEAAGVGSVPGLDLVDTAEWLNRRLGTALAMFGVSLEEFRLLVLLYREGRGGALTIRAALEKLERNRKNLFRTVQQAAEFGWVIWEVKPVAEVNAVCPPRKDRRGGNSHGPRVGLVSLTPQGEKLIESVLPKQERIVHALMRAIDGREQATLSEICRKLRQEDIVNRLRYASALIRAHEGGEEE